MTEQDLKEEFYAIEEGVRHDQPNMLTAVIARMLVRIAAAQEAMVEMSQIDIEEMIQGEIQQRAEARAAELDNERTSRSFLGKKR